MIRKFFLKKIKHSPRVKALRDYHLKPKRIFLKKFYFWLVFLMACGLFYFCFYCDFFLIKEITILRDNGAAGQKVSDEEVKNTIFSVFLKNRFFIFPQGNFLIFDKKAAEEIIKENQQIEDVFIKKIFPDKLKITIKEKNAVANLALLEKNFDQEELADKISSFENSSSTEFMESKEEIKDKYKYYLIDKKGDILEERGEAILNLPLIYDQREISQYPYLNQEELLFILELFKKFPQRLKDIDINSFKIGDSEKSKLIAATSEGWEIYFDFNEDVKNQLEKLFLILQEKIKQERGNLEYIDLRFENRVYYK
ncbi:MAG: Uncharacterized protein Athens101410_4 [Parcubacteria group bacterium Athens1014_10]|nr:MAG: Uncharacterized protein Athens101410_4 [Parcubacteria group bacterium Athens1014_10]TSD06030.1 MAG: Uncharacterized protein Athens071412_4 [Parcubacteria group bacterium Athens0714_12]